MEKNNTALQRFEFSLFINNNIICQRYFDIKGYNEACRESLEIREMMGELAGINTNDIGAMGIVPSFLKKRSNDYLWGYYNPHKAQEREDILVKNINEKEDSFKFEVCVDGEVIGSTTFSGNLFPPKVRYDVNIRALIPEIISEIRYFLTKPTYTKEYGKIKLKRLNKVTKKMLNNVK